MKLFELHITQSKQFKQKNVNVHTRQNEKIFIKGAQNRRYISSMCEKSLG